MRVKLSHQKKKLNQSFFLFCYICPSPPSPKTSNLLLKILFVLFQLFSRSIIDIFFIVHFIRASTAGSKFFAIVCTVFPISLVFVLFFEKKILEAKKIYDAFYVWIYLIFEWCSYCMLLFASFLYCVCFIYILLAAIWCIGQGGIVFTSRNGIHCKKKRLYSLPLYEYAVYAAARLKEVGRVCF